MVHAASKKLFAPIFAGALFALASACDKPAISPGLDVDCRPDDPSCQPGSISGTVTYQGTKRGDVVLLLFSSAALPPPDGLGTQAQSLAKVSQAQMFGGDTGGQGPFSAGFVFSQVPAGSYQIRAFIDSQGQFEPFFDFAQQPHAGDPVGGHLAFDANGVPHLADFSVAAAQSLTNVTVAIGQELPFDPPSFTLVEAAGSDSVTLPVTMDRPALLHLKATNLNEPHASFANAKFGVQLQLDKNGKPAVSDGDGFFDTYPLVILRQLDQVGADGTRSPVDAVHAAVIPAKVNAMPLLPWLISNPGGAPVGLDTLQIFVLPFAVQFLPTPEGQRQLFKPLDAIPPGHYQMVVIEKSGQVWTLPNSLGTLASDPAVRATQNVHVELAVTDLPKGAIRGTVRYQGSQAPGNITVQAYKVDPANRPPPYGTAQPVRVQVIRAAAVAHDASGFNAPYQITGLAPGSYTVLALNDGDGNFGPFTLLQTPTKGDLLGGHLDGTGNFAPVAVTDTAVSADVQLVQVPGMDAQGRGLALDPPAFFVDDSASPAQFAQDARSTMRLTLKARPVAFPVGAGSAASTFFTVALVRDANGKTVDADGDGLPDVWPKVFVVKLDDKDPTGLTQATPTVAIPAAVDPTPWLPKLLTETALQPVTVLASSVSVILRPAAVDVSNPAAPQRLPAMPAGRYKIVVMNQTGQVWQIPNEAGTDALDPRSVAVSNTSSQSGSFHVIPPAGPVPTGVIQGAIRGLPAGTRFTNAYVFAFDARTPPPPVGTGQPLSADVHTQAELAPDGSIPFALRGLPPGSYILSAVVDTRGDFALSPQLFAAAPGEGTLVGQFGPVVATGTAPTTQDVTLVSLPLPPRPSFTLSAGVLGSDIATDVTSIAIDPLVPQRLTLHAESILTPQGSYKSERPTFFPVSYQGCVDANTGQPALTGVAADANMDNVPDVYPKVLVVRLADGDPTGLKLDPRNIVIPAAVDATPFLGELGACDMSKLPIGKTDLSVLLTPAAITVSPFDGSQSIGPVPPGRYGVILISSTGQIWRLPNELQPSLLDASVRALPSAQAFATQGVGLAVSGTPQPAGVITGTVSLNGFAGAVGNLVIAAYAANDPPPPFGTGSPKAATLVPRGFLPNTGTTYALPLSPAAVAAGPLFVTALLDRANRFSTGLSFLATPPFGSQATFYSTGGPLPSPVSLGSSNAASGINLAISANAPAGSPGAPLPYERPMFALDPTSQTVLSVSGAPGALIKLVPATPSGVPYGVARVTVPGTTSTPAFHPLVASLPPNGFGAGFNARATSDAAAAHVGPANSGAFRITTQVLFSPLFAPSGPVCAPVASIDLVNTQANTLAGTMSLCSALINSPDANCTSGGSPSLRQADPAGNPTFLPPEVTTLLVGVPANVCVRLDTRQVQYGTSPTPGPYRISVVEFTGQSWSIPNELSQTLAIPAAPNAGQGAVFIVQP